MAAEAPAAAFSGPLAAAECLPGVDVPPHSLAPAQRLWGIDPSSKRVSVAQLHSVDERFLCGTFRVETLSLPMPDTLTGRCAWAREALATWFATLADPEAHGAPAAVYVEEPFIPRDRRQVPTHLFLFGVMLAALGEALPNVKVSLIGANTWKMLALGKGHGRAEKSEVLRWAQSVGYEGRLEDEADALGVATAGGVLEERRRG